MTKDQRDWRAGCRKTDVSERKSSGSQTCRSEEAMWRDTGWNPVRHCAANWKKNWKINVHPVSHLAQFLSMNGHGLPENVFCGREAGGLAAVASGHQSSSDKGLRRENPKIDDVTLALLADAFFTGIKWLGQASIPPPGRKRENPEGLELLWSKVSSRLETKSERWRGSSAQVWH